MIKVNGDSGRVEASFIHPFSVTEVALGEVAPSSEDKSARLKLRLSAVLEGKEPSEKLNSDQTHGVLRRGPFAKGKSAQEFHRLYKVEEIEGVEKLSYTFRLKSEGMESGALDHLICELEKIE